MSTHDNQPSSDPLIDLELRVARRADELAHGNSAMPLNLHCWFQAEREILGEGIDSVPNCVGEQVV